MEWQDMVDDTELTKVRFSKGEDAGKGTKF